MKSFVCRLLCCFGALVCGAFPVASCTRPPLGVVQRAPLEPSDWTLFKQNFLRPEGRIVDDRNGDVSHSEGQGFGMLLAEAYDDRASFDLIWNWTHANLQTRPDDKLLSWRWRPVASDPAQGAVDDPNNATGGDLLVAWALARAGARWKATPYTEAALALCREVRSKLVRPSPFGPVLLPGIAGFTQPPLPPDRPTGTLILNPSCWVFPAFPELYRLDPDAAWPGLQQSGSALLRGARFGTGELPADWLETSEGTPVLTLERRLPVKPAADPPVFGYDGIRVPLYLLWSGRDPNDELLAPFNRFWGRYPSPEQAPAVVNVETGQRVGADNSLAGAALLGRWLLDLPEAQGSKRVTPNPGDGYYSCVLMLLTRVGRSEVHR